MPGMARLPLRRLRSGIVSALAVLALVGCQAAPPPPPKAMRRPAMPAPAPEPTPRSASAAAYYAKLQETLLAQGLLRSDGGDNVPFTDRMLAENFLRIAMYDEYTRGAGGFARGEQENRLRRWEIPVRVGVRFGASVPADRQATDRARIASFVARLSQITGHPISMDETAPNFLIHIVSEDERMALGPKLRAAIPTLRPVDIAAVTDMPRSTYCLVFALSEGDSGAYTRAFAVIRSEHPDLLRLSCMHEEIAQGLGLPNDSPRARPSIFNDDEEFALLTDHDELLLRMLYSREFRAGMSLSEVRPIAESLARRLMGGNS